MTYDPAFLNPASCQSSITFIDGDRGILRYRGYSIDDLAENCNFLQSTYLLLFGELPNPDELKEWENKIVHHTMIQVELERVHGRLPLQCPPHGDVRQLRRRPLHLLSRST